MLTSEELTAEIVRTSGRGKDQAAAIAKSLSPVAVERIAAAVASRGDVGAAIDFELNAMADAAIGQQAEQASLPEAPPVAE